MKKFGFLIPVLLVVLMTALSNKIFASGGSPMSMLLLLAVPMVLLMFLRPKKTAKTATDFEKKVRGEFAKDAFADDEKLAAQFQSAVKDYNSNMPKSAMKKFTKLAPQCTGDKEIYAVSLAIAHCHLIEGKPLPAIREYTKALNIHATADVAMELGSCHQRLGNLDKARDSYEFALDLDQENLEALSRIATTYVADHDFRSALDYANRVLDKDETHSSSLATAAICHGLLSDPVLCKYYTEQAVEHGYSKNKIEETISTLKKRVK